MKVSKRLLLAGVLFAATVVTPIAVVISRANSYVQPPSTAEQLERTSVLIDVPRKSQGTGSVIIRNVDGKRMAFIWRR